MTDTLHCKMTNHTLLRWPTSLQNLTLALKDLTFLVAFNKNTRVSKASGASEAWQVSQPVLAKWAIAGGFVQADLTAYKQFPHCLEAC